MLNHSASDEVLWEAIVNDDDSRAFLQLYNRHWRKLYRTIKYYLNDMDAAEQILQDIFVVLWERRKFLDIKSFDNYLFITARYHVFKYLKSKKVALIEYMDNLTDTDETITLNKAEEKLSFEDMEKQLNHCLAHLPKRCGEIFRMSRIQQMSNDEIASHFGISKRTVENQITYANKQLQISFQQLSGVVILLALTLSNSCV